MIGVVHFGGYPCDVVVAIAAETPQIVATLKSIGVEDNEIDDLEFDEDVSEYGFTMLVGTKVLIRLEAFDGSAKAYGDLAHEIHHAVCTMMKRMGIPQHDKTEEAYAYAISDLTEKIIPLVTNGASAPPPSSPRQP